MIDNFLFNTAHEISKYVVASANVDIFLLMDVCFDQIRRQLPSQRMQSQFLTR